MKPKEKAKEQTKQLAVKVISDGNYKGHAMIVGQNKFFTQTITIQNTSDFEWPAKSIVIANTYEGSLFKMKDKVILKRLSVGESTRVTLRIKAPEQEGQYTGMFKIIFNDSDGVKHFSANPNCPKVKI